MNELISQLTSLLTEAPGNLIYHLVLVFSIVSALRIAFSHWKTSAFPQARRTLTGLTILLLVQMLLFVIGALSWQNIFDPAQALPPLDRAMALLSLVWVAWLWLLPEPDRSMDATTGLISLLLFIALGISYLQWAPNAATESYAQTLQDAIWQGVTLLFIAFAGASLLIRRPNGWDHGFSFMLLAFVGHALNFAFGKNTASFPGFARLFYLGAYPVLLTLSQRFPAPTALASQHRPTVVQKEGPVRERRRYSTDPKTFHALLALAAEVDVDKINHAITRAIAQTMLADLSFLIYLSDDISRQMVIASGYDLIREENLEGLILNKDSIPMLSNALQRGKPLRLPQSSTSPDLQGLGQLLNLGSPGHLLCTPILKNGKEPIGGVLLLSPYSNRLWNTDDQSFLANISSSLVTIIERGQKLDEIKRSREKFEDLTEEYRHQLDSLRLERSDLATRIDELEKAPTRDPRNQEQSEQIASLLNLQEEAQQEILRLQQENEELNTRRAEAKVEEIKSIGAAHMEQELRASLREIALLQNQLAQSNLRVLELESAPPKEESNEQAAVLASISQELRQPMSSIVGYTDLLLGESVGALGALQRKFVERIKASIERIGNLLDDIIRISTLELGVSELRTEVVDLNKIIDNAMSYTSSQALEKNISISLDLPKELPPIRADKDALQQILIHLLQNAGSVSPVDGTVSLRVQKHNEPKQNFILLQVSDTGGGIPPEDLTRVFSRLYRAENVLIQGVGDTGVGLAIAKTLVEAQQGRIWVESQENIGATFSVLLPVYSSNGKK